MKTLFVSHDASRTGAPLLLLALLRWLRDESDVAFRILLKNGGDLEREFAKAGPCATLDFDKGESRRWRFLGRPRRNRALAGLDDVDLIYSNTITNGALVSELSRLRRPVITHVHELENYIHSSGPANMELVKSHTTLFIAASGAVKENLVGAHGIPEDRIAVVHEFRPVADFAADRVSCPREQLRASLGIPEGAFVVGGCGTTDWRKSPELFVQLAAQVRQIAPGAAVHFLWVGGNLSFELRYDIRKLALANVTFVDHTERPLDYFNCMDAFALVSRVDPFPLVCLEAAALGKPILCFGGAGGMPEFVEDDCGFVVPYLDLAAMAERVASLAADRARSQTLGQAAYRKVAARHDISKAGPEILELMRRVAREREPTSERLERQRAS